MRLVVVFFPPRQFAETSIMELKLKAKTLTMVKTMWKSTIKKWLYQFLLIHNWKIFISHIKKKKLVNVFANVWKSKLWMHFHCIAQICGKLHICAKRSFEWYHFSCIHFINGSCAFFSHFSRIVTFLMENIPIATVNNFNSKCIKT